MLRYLIRQLVERLRQIQTAQEIHSSGQGLAGIHAWKLTLLLIYCFSISDCALQIPKRADITIGSTAYASASCAGERKVLPNDSTSSNYLAAVKFAGDQKRNDTEYLDTYGPRALFRSHDKREAYNRALSQFDCLMNRAEAYHYLVDHPDSINTENANHLRALISLMREQISVTLSTCRERSLQFGNFLSGARLSASRAQALADLIDRLTADSDRVPATLVTQVCKVEIEALEASRGGISLPTQSLQGQQDVKLNAPAISSSVSSIDGEDFSEIGASNLYVPASPMKGTSGSPSSRDTECATALGVLRVAKVNLEGETDKLAAAVPNYDWSLAGFSECTKEKRPEQTSKQSTASGFAVSPGTLLQLPEDVGSEISLLGGIRPYFSYSVDPSLNVENLAGNQSLSSTLLR